MLKRLTISQFVIIDKLTIDFRPGLTVLTGETGAGKSILLDAMGLILGEPPDRDAIRQKSEEAVIEALFAPGPDHALWTLLAKNEIPVAANPEMMVQRTVGRTVKDEIRINDRLVTLDLLKEIGTYLVEIHGQFANQSLFAPSKHQGLLDAFGAYPPDIIGNVATAYENIQRLTKQLDEERTFLARSAHEQPKIERTVNELKKVGIAKNFYEDTLAEHDRLVNIKETFEIFQSVQAQLVASSGAEQALVKSNRIVNSQQKVLTDADVLGPLAKHLETALEHTRYSIDEIIKLMPNYEVDTGAINALAETLTVLRRVATERKIPPEGLFELFEQLTAKLMRIRGARTLIAQIDRDLDIAKDEYLKHAHILTEARVKAGQALSAAITAEMAPLKLLRAQFEVVVEEKVQNPWTALGFNEVTFTARMNPGMPFSPIADTASGGELARMTLALKVVLQQVQTIPTLIFDEVDTGIGGAAAAAVGERIARLADTTQVLVITHSPQVASRGDQHLHVSKRTDGYTTETIVTPLPPPERINEISRMLAGDTITAEAQAAAQSLIAEAHAAAKVRHAGGSNTAQI